MFTQARQQLLSIWNHLSTAQRVVLTTLVVGTLLLVPILVTWANKPTFEVAFNGLSEEDAGQIVEKLAEENIPYELRNSNTILVPSEQVYEVRLRMAREGLPQGGNVGFELFSGNLLGMTEFTQRVNYQRALEGELERTIGSLSAVSAVRVHIVTPEKSLLSNEQMPTTASITVQEKPGTHLNASQVRSITHLVSSSVEGLKPENVVVVDINGNMLASGMSTDENSSTEQSDNHRSAELNAGAELQKKVQGLLDSALGPNRSVVQATVSMDWTKREITKQSYDPESSTVRSSQVMSEVYTTTEGTIGGIPGAMSNLPITATNNISGTLPNQYQRNEQTTNYEITQTEMHEVQAPGQITRISLSVLVDGVQDAGELSTLKSAISAAAGIEEARGDMLEVQSLAFDRSFYETQAEEMDESQRTDLYWTVGQAVAVFLLLAMLLWYVQRLLRNLRLASTQAWTPVLQPVSAVALSRPAEAPLLDETKLAAPQYAPVNLPEPKVDTPAMSEEDEQMQRLMIRLAEENPSTVAEIIQLWLNENDK